MNRSVETVAVQTTGNASTETILVLASLPNSGDAVILDVRCETRLFGSPSVVRVSREAGAYTNSGGSLASGTNQLVSASGGSPSFGLAWIDISGTDVVLKVNHQAGGSTTLDHSIESVADRMS